ncbi:MAG: type II toxin-antitoxin system VapC family toxin [Candidatus Omnitrophica bacterium]|nr:type II toxin-antitoxin system VapC family toxin [Candidatus Omnitrophota bacterium]
MILYCDSSALIKLYLREDGSPYVIGLCEKAQEKVISAVGYAEVCSGIYRKGRSGDLTASSRHKAIRDLDRDWRAIIKVNLSDEVNQIAKRILSRNPLRAFDALHLASALYFQKKSASDICFLSFDERQKAAASYEHLTVV